MVAMESAGAGSLSLSTGTISQQLSGTHYTVNKCGSPALSWMLLLDEVGWLCFQTFVYHRHECVNSWEVFFWRGKRFSGLGSVFLRHTLGTGKSSPIFVFSPISECGSSYRHSWCVCKRQTSKFSVMWCVLLHTLSLHASNVFLVCNKLSLILLSSHFPPWKIAILCRRHSSALFVGGESWTCGPTAYAFSLGTPTEWHFFCFSVGLYGWRRGSAPNETRNKPGKPVMVRLERRTGVGHEMICLPC